MSCTLIYGEINHKLGTLYWEHVGHLVLGARGAPCIGSKWGTLYWEQVGHLVLGARGAPCIGSKWGTLYWEHVGHLVLGARGAPCIGSKWRTMCVPEHVFDHLLQVRVFVGSATSSPMPMTTLFGMSCVRKATRPPQSSSCWRWAIL